MKKLIVLAFLLASLAASAQNINGLVLANKDKSPVPYASVALLQLPDSSIITGVITLGSGEFTFDNIKPGKYFVKISYLGYAPNGRFVELTSQKPKVMLDTIFLNESTQTLNEVTVTGERLKGQELVDRTVYSIPASVAQSSSNGYEILKKIPQVQVDFQNNVTMNGSTNFIIQVDGKQRDKEFLAKLSPEDIQSIEIINNPSGKYEGNIDGVINIILKKEARFGLSGTAGAQYKPFNRPTLAATGTLDYGMGKISVYATAFSFVQNLNINTSALNQYGVTDILSKGSGDFKTSSSSINTGFDYYIDDKNNLSFNINYRPSAQVNGMDNSTLTNENNNVISATALTSNSRTLSDEGSTSLFYKRNFKKQVQEFTVETQFYLFKSKARDKYNYEIGNLPDRYEVGHNNRKYFSAKLNYVHPLGMSVKLETGYQLYYQEMDYDFSTTLPTPMNIYKYSEFRHSVYGGITFNTKKWGLQGNVRVENTNNDINSSLKSDYTCVLPSANIQYKISPKQNAKLTYNRRINRPGIYDLNPFEKVDQTYNITRGNPSLEPEYRNRFQLTYTLNIKSYYVSPYVYYEKITDKIGEQVSTVKSPVNQSSVTLTQPGNLLTGNERGVGLSSTFYFVSLNARYFKGTYNEYVSPDQTIPSRDYSSYSINGYLFAQYPKKSKITSYIFFQYAGVNTNAYSKTYNLPLYGLGIQKQT
ncbi:MAG TPA: outer membrane beta-barrel family protein, partial [Bacteroidales bacterium]|nr:outer membrane beta-barrel family protein [Bacteroidales bacterium]